MSRRRQHRVWGVITAAAVLFALLLVVLPHTHHLTIEAAGPVLAIVFLFGAVHIPGSLWLPSQVSKEHPPLSPDLPSRFQRPPPAGI
jgi:hypothetical protein